MTGKKLKPIYHMGASIGHEVPLEDAVGRVAAEEVEVYPPGIPVILEGFRVSADAVEYLLEARDKDVIDKDDLKMYGLDKPATVKVTVEEIKEGHGKEKKTRRLAFLLGKQADKVV